MQKKRQKIVIGVTCLLIQTVFADSVIINNHANSAEATTNSSCHSSRSYDPRIPPPGSYTIHNKDGSSDEIYTTGENKPYFDNSCGNNTVAPIQPYVAVPPPPQELKK